MHKYQKLIEKSNIRNQQWYEPDLLSETEQNYLLELINWLINVYPIKS